jgi:bifunctional non-homologous end joining protein LigD
MPLEEYSRKRDFKKTPEPPPGRIKTRKEGLSYLIQKHDATRLHYDFRLELDGVLLSWAVTKGPSLNPVNKRLAVRTEDHPLSYGTFEGTIPQGEYGGGTVMMWDEGTWEPKGDPRAGLEKGHLSFALHGERLKGGWGLIRMRGDGKRENWLLVKENDGEARKNAANETFLDELANAQDSPIPTEQRTLRKSRQRNQPDQTGGDGDPEGRGLRR